MTGLNIAPGVAIPHRALARHVGIFGATGTGKTTSAAALVERAPCPVLVLDAKGDLERLGDACSLPAMRVDAMGADFMARALELSDAQAGALHIAMTWAEDSGRDVITLAQLRHLLSDCAADADALGARYGLVSRQSLAAVQRAILRLERAAPWAFRADAPDYRDTRGIHVIACQHIAAVPGLYGAFAAHVLDSLYRGLGELGDVVPGLLVMLDESHLIFQDAPAAVTQRIEQVTRLIRSRGVGLVYVTQSPADLPDAVTAQLATRIQHGLRGTTPRQAKAIRAAAETMPGQVTAATIAALGTGQAVVSVPDARGVPQPGRVVQVTRGTRPTGSLGLSPPAAVVEAAPMRETLAPAPDAVEDEPPFWRRRSVQIAALLIVLWLFHF